MDDDADAGMLPADGLNLPRGEALVNRAVPFPQDHLRALHLLGIESAEDLVRIPDDHLVERDAHLVRGVAAEMLIGQEQHLLAVREAHFSVAIAFDDVQTVPPRSPTNDLIEPPS